MDIQINSNNPIIVDYMVTSLCNLSCPFCIGPKKINEAIVTKNLLEKFVRFIKGRNIRNITLSGGEPSLSVWINDVIRLFYKYCIDIAIHTNGTGETLLDRNIDMLNWIGLPIDGVSDDVCLAMRGDYQHFNKVIKFIDNIRQKNKHDLKVKIGTVVTKINIHEIPYIAKSIARIKPDLWRIYQLRGRVMKKSVFEYLSVDEGAIYSMYNKVKKEIGGLPIKLSMEKESNRAYIIINPNFDVLIPREIGYIECGSLFDINGEIKKRAWENALRHLDMGLHTKNAAEAFLL